MIRNLETVPGTTAAVSLLKDSGIVADNIRAQEKRRSTGSGGGDDDGNDDDTLEMTAGAERSKHTRYGG